MLIKSADDRQPDVAVLEKLLARPGINSTTTSAIERELRTIRAGAKGERDAAYEIDFDYATSPNRAVIHDLRLDLNGRVAQIDHLIIDRLLTLWVCESKHFAEGVGVNEHGEWVAFYGGRAHGIPSPIEQNRRHIAVLGDVFHQQLVAPKKRLGMTVKPVFRSVILVSNNARVSRPKTKAGVDGLNTVMKVEKLQSTIAKDADARSLSSIARVVSSETIERLALDLVGLHRPWSVDWEARFGLATTGTTWTTTQVIEPARRLFTSCEQCRAPISRGVARYSAEHPERFGGRILCMPCQKEVTA
jgi:nuclease-like protein